MNYSASLQKLQRLRDLVEKLRVDPYSSSPETQELRREIYELYGEVEDVYQRFGGHQKVEMVDGKQKKVFNNYFEAGYLSGRTFHLHEGYTELNKVVGRVRQATDGTSVPRDARSIGTVIEILQRFRQCCQYLKNLPADERAVQDIIWIMLRSRFDRLDREDSLPRFGVKKYVPDFGIPELCLLIEVKFVGEATRPSDIQEEILADIPGYLQDQEKYDAIVVFIYDNAHKIRDDRKLAEDLRSVSGIVDVLVVPGLGSNRSTSD